ncbi:MAG: hypothetical protein ABI851_05445 [Saprospiraceae bacterium]
MFKSNEDLQKDIQSIFKWEMCLKGPEICVVVKNDAINRIDLVGNFSICFGSGNICFISGIISNGFTV